MYFMSMRKVANARYRSVVLVTYYQFALVGALEFEVIILVDRERLLAIDAVGVGRNLGIMSI